MSQVSSQRLIRLGQVGIGYWGKNLLRNFASLPDVELLSVCDQRSEILEAVKIRYPSIHTTHRFSDLLENPDIDALVIATDTFRHSSMTLASLMAGKHTFVEKPMAQNPSEAERLVELAEANDLRLMVGHLLLYHPAFQYVENLIHRGELGDIYYLYSMRVNLGIVRQQENAWESLAPHDVAVALQLMDEKSVGVAAHGQAYLQKEIEDVVFATLYFENRKCAHIHTSWLDPHKVRKVTVVGSKKMAVIDDVAPAEKVRIYDKGIEVLQGENGYADYAGAMTIRSGDIHIPRIPMQEPLRLECQHFVDCIRSGRTPLSDGRNGLAVVRLLEAAQLSLKNKGVRIDL
jgi:predicted dehydrogenase